MTQTDGIVVRRTRLAPFVPPQPQKGTVSPAIVARDALRRSPRPAGERLSRNRVIAGDLPYWSPMPPGEIPVISRRVPESNLS